MSDAHDDPLVAEFQRLARAHAGPSAFYELRAQAVAAGNSVVEILCLGKLTIVETRERRRLLIRREYAAKSGVGAAFLALGSAERDAGNLDAARAAFLEACRRLKPSAERSLRRAEKALGEIELAEAGNRQPIEERAARNRVILAIHRARVGSSMREFVFVRRHLELALAKPNASVARIYFDAIEPIASLCGQEVRILPYARELAHLEGTVSALQQAAVKYELAGRQVDAVALLESALEVAKEGEPNQVEQLEAKIQMMRRTLGGSRPGE